MITSKHNKLVIELGRIVIIIKIDQRERPGSMDDRNSIARMLDNVDHNKGKEEAQKAIDNLGNDFMDKLAAIKAARS